MSDKRSVSTDALETLGTIIGEGAGRDAIHLAVEPVVAAQKLLPGEAVGFLTGGKVGKISKPLGIVDPFLKGAVLPGERFWLILFPRQITSLRHVWTHPDFPEAATPKNVSESKEFLDYAADTIGVSTEDLMSSVKYYLDERDGGSRTDTICFGDDLDSWELPEGFWGHYEAFTGRTVPEAFREVYFRCAC